jgi:benzoate membrane transport protein
LELAMTNPDVPTTVSRTRATRRDHALLLMVALVGLSFSATGPVAIMIAAARDSGVSPAMLSSWVFAAFFINGLATIALSAWLKTPVVFFWTIPGTVLIAPVAVHYGFEAVVGTYWACAAVLLVLGCTNLVAAFERWVPLPVVMAMIAGIFVNFVAGIFQATLQALPLGGAMVVAYLWLLRREAAGRVAVPPILGAIAAGVAVLLAGPTGALAPVPPIYLATVVLVRPAFDVRAIADLLLPMLVTVLFVQNAQGIAVIRSAGYGLSNRLVTLASGALTAASACVGGFPSVLAGPCNAILVSAGAHGRHYLAAIMVGAISLAIGLGATAYIGLLNSFPATFIAILAGLAMLPVVEKSFRAAFASPYPLSAVFTFAITLSNVKVAGIGAAFWGMVAGAVIAAWVEPGRSARQPR